MTDRQSLHGLVALYDIRPGNGAGLSLQRRSSQGAHVKIRIRVGLGWGTSQPLSLRMFSPEFEGLWLHGHEVGFWIAVN